MGRKDFHRRRQRLADFSLSALPRLLRLKLTGRELLVSGGCHACGRCCRRITLQSSAGRLRSPLGCGCRIDEVVPFRKRLQEELDRGGSGARWGSGGMWLQCGWI